MGKLKGCGVTNILNVGNESETNPQVKYSQHIPVYYNIV